MMAWRREVVMKGQTQDVLKVDRWGLQMDWI